jgi:hypothetical protein
VERSIALPERNENVQNVELFWSADGKAVVLTLIYDACQGNESSSIVRIDTVALTTYTLLERDERRFTIDSWPDPAEPTLLLIDKTGDDWSLDISSGSMAPLGKNS